MNDVDLIKNNLSLVLLKLNKEHLAKFLNIEINYRTKKQELIDKVIEIIQGNELMTIKFYNQYKLDFALKPTQVEEILKCTKTERQRWTKEDKLSAIGYDRFSKWGNEIEYPLYDIIKINQISQEIINQWRHNYQNKVKENRNQAGKKAIETKKKNSEIRDNFKSEFKKILASWYKIDIKLGVTFQLAFWTVWISRWAKENHIKCSNSNKIEKSMQYNSQEQTLYDLKNEAIKELLKSPYKRLGFYRPEYHFKESLHLCDKHYDLWKLERNEIYVYMDKWDFYDTHKKDIKKCAQCNYTKIEDFYSLYYLSIEDPRIEDFKFSFHTPYPLGKAVFPNINQLEFVQHEEQDGIFRFGRALLDEEKIVYTEKFVLKKFEESLEKFKLYIIS